MFSFGQVALAQQGATISGVVIDASTKEPIVGATVIAVGTNYGAISNDEGVFSLSDVKLGKYKIEFSFVGYTAQEIEVALTSRSFRFDKPIALKGDGVMVDMTMIQGDAPIAKQLGDTTQFNAGAYKTNPDATAEDLVAKMPGFSVEGGKISSQGEEVTQVYVDGKPYFKDNPMAALSSLPADAIESIQEYDEKSDQSRMSGFDDGDTQKTLNIVTKAKSKNNYFGDVIIGYGTEGHYNAKGNVNIFRGDHRFTVGFGFNDINQSSVSGGSRFYGSSAINGLQESNGVKLNYSGEFKESEDKFLELGANYMFTNTQNSLDQILVQDYFSNPTAGYDSRIYNAATLNNSRANNHSLRLDVQAGLGEKNMIFFRPYVSLSNSASNINSITSNTLDGIVNSAANTSTHNDAESLRAGGNITWMHKFNNQRSATVDVRASITDSNSDQYLIGSTSSLTEMMFSDSLINQYASTLSTGNTVSSKLTLTQRLSKSSGLIFNYRFSYNWSDNDKYTYLYDPLLGTYTNVDLALSNELNRDYFTNTGGVGYSYKLGRDLSFNAGVDYENASLTNSQTLPSVSDRDYTFNSIRANMRFDYSINENQRISARFYSAPSLPSMTQLQDVVDNSNPLQITTGNPNLDKANSMRAMFMYNNMNPDKSTSLRIFSFNRGTTNSIVSNTRFLTQDEYINGVFVQSGAQVSSYANSGTSWSSYSGINYTFPIKAIGSNLSTGLTYNYSQNPSIYNGVEGNSQNNNLGLKLGLSSNISENLDFTVSSNTSYSMASSDIGTTTNSNYLTESVGLKFNWIFLKSFVFNTDYTYNYYYFTEGANELENFNMLNMGIGRKFLKNQAELRISAYDILGQNKGYAHSVGSLFVQDTQSNVLSQYFMLSFSYKFNTMKGKMPSTSNSRGYGDRGGMGGPPRP